MFKNKIKSLFAKADIKINGSRPWDIKVNDPRFYDRAAVYGIVGLGDAYVDGWWDCDALDQLFYRFIIADIPANLKYHWTVLLNYLRERIFNLQTIRLSFLVGEQHYDLGNELFKNTLDKKMAYSCGYWKNAKTLDEAQEAKLDLICKKIGLKPGMRVLDIGCGWGSFVKYTAEKYRVKVVGITISKEQVKYVKEICRGLPVEVRLQDYRSLNEKFDRIVSVGMFEHVGYKNYCEYMTVVERCLKDDGLFLLHNFGGKDPAPTLNQPETKWIEKYIFPRMCFPSLGQIISASDGLLIAEDIHNFGADYDQTLMSWFKNFNKNWPKLKSKYGDRFYRIWKYYLLSGAGGFRSRKYQLWQIVFSKNGVPGGYKSVR